ncbi:NB-ARC domain-containing protein [Chlorobium phaeobacteroides]|uniref:Tetratricopeptide TPR_3 n=1 Tax=Chlorobium phaeobacteroides (strain DSM 266 / SMG 266 / 2430) TaxID=290317 RepID=A1BIB3_CHLPD|nr:NB-ARC domain-containing protein [Chlorobium phaeobacteroides]ABL66140.1 Tetratricopeptide TPR_3 [Chlorobium phaeobacteroides DSM 266]
MNKFIDHFVRVVFFILFLFISNLSVSYARVIKNIQGKNFEVIDSVAVKHMDLIELILKTESMDDNERQYWLDVLPYMTKAQVDRLYHILEKERTALFDLEKKYQDALKAINNKYMGKYLKIKYDQHSKLSKKPLFFVEKIDCEGNKFVIKKYSNNKNIDSRIFIGLSELNDLYYDKLLSAGDKFNILIFIQYIINDYNEYAHIYERDDIMKLFKITFHIAFDFDDLKILDDMLLMMKKDKDTFSDIEKNYYLYKYHVFKKEHSKALGVIEKVFDGLIDNKNMTKIWINDCLYIPHIMLGEMYGKNSAFNEMVIKKYIKLILSSPGGLDYSVKKGDVQSRLILLDIFRKIYADMFTDKEKIMVDNYLKKKIDEKSYFKNSRDSEWYYILNQAYFKGDIGKLYNDHKKNILEKKQRGYMLDGVIIESGVFYAFKLYEQKKYTEALNILDDLKIIGESVKSPAKGYVEKYLAEALNIKIQEKLSFTGQLTSLMNSFFALNSAYITSILSFLIFVIIYLLYIIFPYWDLFQIKVLNDYIFNKIIFLPATPLIITRILRYLENKSYPLIPFIPYDYRLNKYEFQACYIPISLIDSDQYVHSSVFENITSKNASIVTLYGEGGMGKTLTAQKVCFDLSKKGYLPVFLEEKILGEDIDENKLEMLIGSFYKNKRLIETLSKMAFSKYVFVIDDIMSKNTYSIIMKIRAIQQKAIFILTTRNEEIIEKSDFSVQLNSSNVDFGKYIKTGMGDRIKAYESFVMQIKNTLLISIIIKNDIDLTDIIRNKPSGLDMERIILKKYIDYQIELICKKYNPDLKINYSTYLLKKTLCYLAHSVSQSLPVNNCLCEMDKNQKNDQYYRDIMNLDNNKQKNNLQILDSMQNSAIVYIDSSNNIKFTHDLIGKYMLETCEKNNIQNLVTNDN